MHAKVVNSGAYTFFLLVVYGENNMVQRRELWSKIGQIKITIGNNDWLLGGDFNEIQRPKEGEW